MAKPGTFPPGVSGNPGGKPKGYAEFMAACREYTGPALAKIIELMDSKDERISLNAAQYLVDRGWGKPPQAVAGEGGEGAAELVIRWLTAQSK